MFNWMWPPVTSSLVDPNPIFFYLFVSYHHTSPSRLPHIHGCCHRLGWLQQHLPLVWSSDFPAEAGRKIVYWSRADTGKRRQYKWVWRERDRRKVVSSVVSRYPSPSSLLSQNISFGYTLYSQVGLVQYGENPVHEWSLGDFRTKEEVVKAARNLSRREGRETKTAQAIMVAWWGIVKGNQSNEGLEGLQVGLEYIMYIPRCLACLFLYACGWCMEEG